MDGGAYTISVLVFLNGGSIIGREFNFENKIHHINSFGEKARPILRHLPQLGYQFIRKTMKNSTKYFRQAFGLEVGKKAARTTTRTTFGPLIFWTQDLYDINLK